MTKSEALNILNPQHNTADALRQAYREACKKYHPDHGGDLEMMKLVNAAYDILKGCKWTNEETDKATEDTPDIAAEIWEMWKKVRHLQRISGEVCGLWIWLDGETWRYKKFLKENGFGWSGNKRKWYWRPETARKKTRKIFSMDDIRGRFGSIKMQQQSVFSLA